MLVGEHYEEAGTIVRGGGDVFKGLQSIYPVEYECIKKELTSGERTSQEEFVRLRQEWTQKKMDEERERSERWAEQDKKNWEKWVRAGEVVF